MTTGLSYREHPVWPELRAHVRCLWELGGLCAAVVPELLLPDGCMELVLNFGGPVDRLDADGTVIPGPRTFLLAEPRRPVTSVSTGQLALVGVRFWPGASASFVDAPLSERVDGYATIRPKSLATVLRFRRVLRAIDGQRPDWATVARQCGYSDQAHLTRDFRRFAGRPPATFSREDHPLVELGTGS